MRQLIILFMLAISLFGFDKTLSVLVDSEKLNIDDTEVLVSYHCFEERLYIVLPLDGVERVIPVVWYKDGVLDDHVLCVDYDRWQLSTLLETE